MDWGAKVAEYFRRQEEWDAFREGVVQRVEEVAAQIAPVFGHSDEGIAEFCNLDTDFACVSWRDRFYGDDIHFAFPTSLLWAEDDLLNQARAYRAMQLGQTDKG